MAVDRLVRRGLFRIQGAVRSPQEATLHIGDLALRVDIVEHRHEIGVFVL